MKCPSPLASLTPMQPKVAAMLSIPLAHGILPWSLLRLQGPHLQDGYQILHPDSSQVLGDTEMLMTVSRMGTHAQASVPIDKWLEGPAAWLPMAVGCQPHNLLDACWLSRDNLSGLISPPSTTLPCPSSLVAKQGGLTSPFGS
jgi:hypothetical protein